uniref:Aminopeptidase n=1 Tax=Physcomitrium patens TaxID=3218 RepID=A0A7I4BPT3_PHYPA
MATRVAAAAGLAVITSYLIAARLRKNSKAVKLTTAFQGKIRLPTSVTPSRYDLELTPKLDICKFDGKMTVSLRIVEDTKYIVLNAADLTITDKSVWLRSNTSRQMFWPKSVELHPEDEILVLAFEENLSLGEAVLSMEFQGTLNDQMRGFYRSSYKINGETRNMAVTQFEPADARRCFPCWDEPSFKATFKMTLHVPVDRVALSNMPIAEETRSSPKMKTIKFEESPRMSTYLVAIVVGELEYIEGHTPDGRSVRVYTEVGKTHQGKFALDVALRTLPFYAKYFGTEYPLPKLDMVAIPDFAAGAMENYGLVTYREAALLFDEKVSAAANKQRVAVVVAHELAHQWFGNLVTMEWWTHLWLNEGFATWIWTQFVEQTVDAFRLDGLVESHPIEVEVGHVREIDEIFDAISYKKGAAIIRMLQTYLGADTFQRGLVSYIKRYEYKNARTEDLWSVLSEESGAPVKELMDSWTKQQGYPVVSVQLKSEALVIEQSQYLFSGHGGDGEWVVPVTYCVGAYKNKMSELVRLKTSVLSTHKLIHDKQANSDSDMTSQDSSPDLSKDWIKLNVGQTGFYRVKYDDELALRLRSAISAGSLEATDRFGVLDDTYALCIARKQPLSVLLSLMEVYRSETDYTVLMCMTNVSYRILKVVGDAIPSAAKDLKHFVSNLLLPSAERLGWEARPDEGHLDSMLRGELLSALVFFGHEDTINEAKRRFEAFLKDRESPLLPADTRKVAYTAVMQSVKSSDKTGYESLLKIYRETDVSQERTRVLSTLGASCDPAIVSEALDFLLSPEVRNQDAIWVLAGISGEGRDAAWSWLKENWKTVWNRFGESVLITRFISSIVSLFSSDDKADEIKDFFNANSAPGIDRTVGQSIERVRITSEWVKYVQKEEGIVEKIKQLGG